MPVPVATISTSKLYADFVEETTNTESTAPYVLLGATAGNRTFASQFASGDSIAYVCTDDAGTWEAGIGTLDFSGNLSRSIVTGNSTTGGGIINWAPGTKRVYCALHAGVVTPKHNFAGGTTDPDAGFDNESQGYGPGSLWWTDTAVWMYGGSTYGWRTIG